MIESRGKLERWTVAVVALAVTLFIILSGNICTSGDTESYINAWKSFTSGTVDFVRTPVYPCLLAIARAIGGEDNMLLYVFIAQNVVAGIASWYFYKLAVRMLHSGAAAFVSSIIFICLPVFTLFRSYILTESLSLSGLVFLTYCVVGIYDDLKSVANLVGMAFWLLFLIFLRPSFLYLLPVLLVAFALMAVNRRAVRAHALAGMAVVVVAGGLMLTYMNAFKRAYGVFTCTRIGIINDLCIMDFDGSLDPEKAPDPVLAQCIEETYDKYGRGPSYEKMNSKEWGDDVANNILYRWDLPTLNETVKGSKTIAGQIRGVLIRCHYLPGDEVRSGKPVLAVLVNYLFICGFLTVFLYALLIVAHAVRRKEIPLCSFLLFMLGVSNIIVTVVGAQAEWSRLVYPSKFIYLLMNVELALAVLNKIYKKHYKID